MIMKAFPWRKEPYYTRTNSGFLRCLVGLFLVSDLQVSTACPDLCQCDQQTVTCPDAALIPVDIPEETTILKFPNHRFTNLPGYTFLPHNLNSLQELHLREGNLEIIDDNAFHGLPQLKSLHLDYNNIETIAPNAFDGLGRVTHLYLYYNKLQQLHPRQFVGLTLLYWLSLSFNALTDIPANAFQGLENLHILYLRYNHLSVLGDYRSFSGLHHLQMLSLENNHALRTIGDETFSQLYALTDLELGGNLLAATSFTEATFSGLHKLTTLNFHDNPLGVVPSLAFKPIPQLDKIYLTSCQLRSVQPGDFQYVPELKELYLDDNVALIEIPTHTLTELPLLEMLHYSQTSITEIPAFSFQNATNLRKLVIADSKLSSIKENGFDGLENIHQLDLSNNKLTTLFHNILDSIQLSGNLEIDLSDNPWACDCHLRDFVQRVEKRYTPKQVTQVFNSSQPPPKCQSPPQLAGQGIFSVPTHSLSCDAPTPKDATHEANHRKVTIGSCVGLATVVLLCTVCGIFFYRKRQRKAREMLRSINDSLFPLDDDISI
ncbi:leucine-rich repeat-containing protein 15-like [Asterias rubens]|uniref:leucine-rich repeat-containing protein 15-like n=1 Tax=Asterias rubens TaxID=7604 RepID=UPI0014555B26|nr:leucine-rich repeat-containing protein 15-like [Asterias rubens]XP_033645711.1 leucine-rich repeat-containing protein 15-like [Asterias rubens]